MVAVWWDLSATAISGHLTFPGERKLFFQIFKAPVITTLCVRVFTCLCDPCRTCINTDCVRTSRPHGDQSPVLVRQNIISEVLVKFRGLMWVVRWTLGFVMNWSWLRLGIRLCLGCAQWMEVHAKRVCVCVFVSERIFRRALALCEAISYITLFVMVQTNTSTPASSCQPVCVCGSVCPSTTHPLLSPIPINIFHIFVFLSLCFSLTDRFTPWPCVCLLIILCLPHRFVRGPISSVLVLSILWRSLHLAPSLTFLICVCVRA